MKLSVVIICWNDSKYILDCIQSVYAETHLLDFEIIVTDNASTDGSVEYVRKHFSKVKVVNNGANLGFAKGNNAGIGAAQGEYVLILNPDTIVHARALEKLVAFADLHPDAGAFGCRTLNPDGSLQHTAQPEPTVLGYLIGALCLRWLSRFSNRFLSDTYFGWDGTTEREIGFQAGCSLMVRRDLLNALGGFDERFFHQFEDADLCQRIRQLGSKVLFCPDAEITHIGGQRRGGYPAKVVLETERSKYKYFYKHYGVKGLVRIRYVSFIAFGLRYLGWGVLRYIRPRPSLEYKFITYQRVLNWHWHLNPISFIEKGDEPDVGCQPLAPSPNL